MAADERALEELRRQAKAKERARFSGLHKGFLG